MADTLESLEIEVTHSASGAAGEISGVANALHDLGNQLKKVLPDMKELAKVLSGVKGNININTNIKMHYLKWLEIILTKFLKNIEQSIKVI